MNKYYISSNEWRFSVFKGKYVISEERMEMNLWEMSEKKNIYQPWTYPVFPPISCPWTEYLSACLTR